MNRYEETVHFRFFELLAWFFWLLPLAVLGLLVYQIAVGPVGSRPAPTWVLGLLLVLMTLTPLILRNFRSLQITLTADTLTVGYGSFKSRKPLSKITSCYLGSAGRSLLRYGGYGIRLARSKGAWQLAYVGPGTARVVVEFGPGEVALVFSSRQPELALAAIKGAAGLA